MATKTEGSTVFFVNDAAERFFRSPSRIRQICIEHNIGRCPAKRIRILTEKDMETLGKIIENEGYEGISEKNRNS